jgi:hypothetical protein
MDSLRDKKGSWTQQKTRYELSKKKDAEGVGGLANHIKRKTKNLKLSKEFPATAPATGMEFDRDWRRHCNGIEQRYRYIMLVTPQLFATLFKADIDANILGGILEALAYAVEAGEPSALTPPLVTKEEGKEVLEEVINKLLKAWNEALVSCGRFSLSMALLEEKQDEIVVKLRKIVPSFLVASRSSSGKKK